MLRQHVAIAIATFVGRGGVQGPLTVSGVYRRNITGVHVVTCLLSLFDEGLPGNLATALALSCE